MLQMDASGGQSAGGAFCVADKEKNHASKQSTIPKFHASSQRQLSGVKGLMNRPDRGCGCRRSPYGAEVCPHGLAEYRCNECRIPLRIQVGLGLVGCPDRGCGCRRSPCEAGGPPSASAQVARRRTERTAAAGTTETSRID